MVFTTVVITTMVNNLHQMTRWVNTKETHCKAIITRISEYCLCQRFKAAELSAEDYTNGLKVRRNREEQGVRRREEPGLTRRDVRRSEVKGGRRREEEKNK